MSSIRSPKHCANPTLPSASKVTQSKVPSSTDISQCEISVELGTFDCPRRDGFKQARRTRHCARTSFRRRLRRISAGRRQRCARRSRPKSPRRHRYSQSLRIKNFARETRESHEKRNYKKSFFRSFWVISRANFSLFSFQSPQKYFSSAAKVSAIYTDKLITIRKRRFKTFTN